MASLLIFEAIVSKVLESHHRAGFWLLAGLWLGAAALGAVAMAWGGWLAGLAAQRIQLRLRDSVFAHTQRLPVDYFDERRLSDLMVRLTDDIAVVESAGASGPVSLLTSVISVVVFAVAALIIRWDLALLAFAVAPAFWVQARLFSGRCRHREVAVAAGAAGAHGFISAPPDGYDTLAGQRGRLLTVTRRFAADHTAIVITHDPRVVAAADDVLRLRQPASTPVPRRTHHRVNSAG